MGIFAFALIQLRFLYTSCAISYLGSRVSRLSILIKMQYTTGLVLAVVGLAAAQSSSTAAAGVTSVTSASTSSSTSESGCGESIDLIIQTCLGSTQAQLAACDATDWDCLCTQQTNVLTCYNNCPSDPNAFGAQQTKTSYCNASETDSGATAFAPAGGLIAAIFGL